MTKSNLWIFVVGALVLGLLIPDKINPVKMLMDKLNEKKDDKKETTKKSE